VTWNFVRETDRQNEIPAAERQDSHITVIVTRVGLGHCKTPDRSPGFYAAFNRDSWLTPLSKTCENKR